jgi:hypothetical protein
MLHRYYYNYTARYKFVNCRSPDCFVLLRKLAVLTMISWMCSLTMKSAPYPSLRTARYEAENNPDISSSLIAHFLPAIRIKTLYWKLLNFVIHCGIKNKYVFRIAVLNNPIILKTPDNITIPIILIYFYQYRIKCKDIQIFISCK